MFRVVLCLFASPVIPATIYDYKLQQRQRIAMSSQNASVELTNLDSLRNQDTPGVEDPNSVGEDQDKVNGDKCDGEENHLKSSGNINII